MKTKILTTLYIVGLLMPFWEIYSIADVIFNYLRRAPETTFIEELPLTATLSWTYVDGVNPAEGFRVYRKAPGEPRFTLLATLSSETRQVRIPDVISCYQAVAFNDGGESEPVGNCNVSIDGKKQGESK